MKNACKRNAAKREFFRVLKNASKLNCLETTINDPVYMDR